MNQSADSGRPPAAAAQTARAPVVAKRAARAPAAAILLGAAAAVWSAIPGSPKALAGIVLFVVVTCVVGSALRLSLGWIPLPDSTFMLSVPIRAWLAFLGMIRVPPWEEGTVLAALWLEVLHPARPWHTAVLAAVLTAYLLATHLADSGASADALRPQMPVLAAGVCLLALGAAFAMLPAITPGGGSALLRVVAAIAVIIAAGLAMPHLSKRPGLSGRPAGVARQPRRATPAG
ncbi:MAG: hypothetical protein JO345_40130 [Streptosporangiaceae bacterium]|nr:hypothetical protein [Streptosporangiaceae bacterium]